jgi:hypothetical protein
LMATRTVGEVRRVVGADSEIGPDLLVGMGHGVPRLRSGGCRVGPGTSRRLAPAAPLISQWKLVARDSPPRKWTEASAPLSSTPLTAIWSGAVIGARCPVAWLRTCRRRVARVAVSSVNSPSAMVTASMVWPNGIVSIVAPLSRSRSYSPSGGNSAPQPMPEAMMLVDTTSPT